MKITNVAIVMPISEKRRGFFSRGSSLSVNLSAIYKSITIIAWGKFCYIILSTMNTGKLEIGIIGRGRFGGLLYEQLQRALDPDVRVKAFDAKLPESDKLEDVLDSRVVFCCVPISELSSVLKQIEPITAKGTVVVDVCSVKMLPAEWMLEILPEGCEICATHPIFGPDSVRNNGDSLAGLPLVFCPVRLSAQSEDFLKGVFVDKLGVSLKEMSPEEHDRKMAYSLLYTHLVGRIGQQMEVGTTGIDTKGFEKLLEVQQYVVNDSWQLFKDMNLYNPFATEMRKKFKKALEDIESELNN